MFWDPNVETIDAFELRKWKPLTHLGSMLAPAGRKVRRMSGNYALLFFKPNSDLAMAAVNSVFNIEVNSFISKLVQLNTCGVTASLNISTFSGRINVSLHADLSVRFLVCSLAYTSR